MDLNYLGGLWMSLPENRPDIGHGWSQATYRFAPNEYPIHSTPSNSRSEATEPQSLTTHTLPPLNSILSTQPPSSPYPPSSSFFPHLPRFQRHRSHHRERQHADNSFSHDHHLAGSPLQLQSPERSPLRENIPVSRPASRLSWNSEEVSVSTFPRWPSQSQEGFIDLTADSSPSIMPPRPRKRPTSGSHHSEHPSISSSKRPKLEDGQANEELRHVAEVDLAGADEDNNFARVLEEQRIASVKAQQEQADKPVSFSTLQCIICMEPMTNITVTHCGRHLTN